MLKCTTDAFNMIYVLVNLFTNMADYTTCSQNTAKTL